jgi:hypothetical protein
VLEESGGLERGLAETYPPSVTWGASYAPTAKATFLWDFVWTEWRQITEDYRNTVDVRLGTDYRLSTDLSIRAGFISRGERLGAAPVSLGSEPARSTGRRMLTAGLTLRRGTSGFHLAIEDNHLLDGPRGPTPEPMREAIVSVSALIRPTGHVAGRG